MKKINHVIVLFCMLALISAFFLSHAAFAQGLKDAFITDTGNPLGDTAQNAGYEPISAENNIENTIGLVIQAFLGILGIIFLILMIYAGYSWMTAQGNDAKVDKAKSTLTAAIIGLIIILAAYAISYYVIRQLSVDALQTSAN